jgi:hypothetical protein
MARSTKRITTTILLDVKTKKEFLKNGQISISRLTERAMKLFLEDETFPLWILGCHKSDKN